MPRTLLVAILQKSDSPLPAKMLNYFINGAVFFPSGYNYNYNCLSMSLSYALPEQQKSVVNVVESADIRILLVNTNYNLKIECWKLREERACAFCRMELLHFMSLLSSCVNIADDTWTESHSQLYFFGAENAFTF